MLKNTQKIILLLVGILLAGCASNVDTVYDKAYTNSITKSKPIYLSFKENKNLPFYFILKHKSPSDIYKLHVRWNSKQRELLYNGTKTTLKFFINNAEIISLSPIYKPKVMAYNADNNGHEEEAVFALTAEQMQEIANASDVHVELSGKYITVVGHFNKYHTGKSFQKFLQES